MARRSFTRGRHGSGRLTLWLGSADFSAYTNLAGGTAVLNQLITLDQPVTIMRTRGVLFVASDQVVASELTAGVMGMAVVSTPAATAGIASVPTPVTENFSDLFFLHQYYGLNVGTNSATTSLNTVKGFAYPFDSKAMRKVNDDESIIVTLENATTVGINFAMMFRMLIKLS